MAGHKTEQPAEGYRLSLTFGIGGRREGRSKKVLRGQDGNSLGRTKVCWDLGEEESADAPSAKKKRSRGRLESADGQKAGFYQKIKRDVK